MHALYICLDLRGAALYIGITNDPRTRFKAHAKLKSWWCDVNEIEIMQFRSRSELRKCEHFLIELYDPKYNIQHKMSQKARDEMAESLRKSCKELLPEAEALRLLPFFS